MNLKRLTLSVLPLLLSAALLAVAALASAAPGEAPLALVGAPTVVAYQGEVQVDGVPYSGDGHFKFAVVNPAGDNSYWSNDGSSVGGAEPTAAVELTVSQGIFSVLLGDTTLSGMTQALAAAVFGQPNSYLRVWFSASTGGPFSQLTPDTRIAAVPYALQAQEAANANTAASLTNDGHGSGLDADTVDGLHASELGAHYQNVVVVAKSGGDYTSVQAAIDSITDAAASNPYLVWVAPGVYQEQVTMKPHVHLQGAGQEATIISSTATSAWPPSQATVILASDVSLRDLTVTNSGTGEYNVAMLATAGVTRTLAADVTLWAQGSGQLNYAIRLTGSGTGVRLQQVTALCENGNTNYGLYKSDDAAATLLGGAFTGRGGTTAYGIRNSGSSTMLDAENVTVLGENGSSTNYGLSNSDGAAARLRGGSYSGRAGTYSRGINNSGSSTTLDAESITVLSENSSSSNFGLSNTNGASAALRGGSFTARGGSDARGIANGDTGTTLETENITALGEEGSSNFGLNNSNSATARLRGGSFTARGGTNNRGIYNWYTGTTLVAEKVTVLGESGSGLNYGLHNSASASATITQSVLEGAPNSVYEESGTVGVSNSRLVGSAASAGVACVGVSRGNTFLTSGCP